MSARLHTKRMNRESCIESSPIKTYQKKQLISSGKSAVSSNYIMLSAGKKQEKFDVFEDSAIGLKCMKDMETDFDKYFVSIQ